MLLLHANARTHDGLDHALEVMGGGMWLRHLLLDRTVRTYVGDDVAILFVNLGCWYSKHLLLIPVRGGRN